MRAFSRYFLVSLLVFSLLLTACGRTKEFSVHSSNEGYVPETFIPADVGMMFSYSLRNDEQFAAVQAIEDTLGDSGRVSRAVTENFDSSFVAGGLDFETDLQPAFGDQFRMVFGGRPGTEEVEGFSAVTLESPDQMEIVLKKLDESGELSYKKLSDLDAYVNEESNFYAAVYEDLLLVANQPEGLVEMTDLEEDDSLWATDWYQDALKDLDSNYLFYGLLFPSLFAQDVDLPAGFSISDIPSVIERQSLVVRAEEDGFSFDVNVYADEDLASEAGVSFDTIPKSAPYLHEEIPSTGLMAYFESYGLAQTFEEASALGDDTASLESLSTFFRSYFAMDFEEEVLSFFDRGYALALHQNGDGIVPGVTLYVDVSSDENNAQSFVDKLEGQLSGLMLIFETALPGAVTMGTTEIDGETLSLLELDLSAVPQTGESPLPSVVTSSAIKLAYGLLDGRLIITTAEAWEEGGETVAESALYNSLESKLDDVDEGLILLDAQGIGAFVSSLRALREQLGLSVSDATLDVEDLLDGFLGGITASKTKAYESHFGGFLMIAN